MKNEFIDTFTTKINTLYNHLNSKIIASNVSPYFSQLENYYMFLKYKTPKLIFYPLCTKGLGENVLFETLKIFETIKKEKTLVMPINIDFNKYHLNKNFKRDIDLPLLLNQTNHIIFTNKTKNNAMLLAYIIHNNTFDIKYEKNNFEDWKLFLLEYLINFDDMQITEKSLKPFLRYTFIFPYALQEFKKKGAPWFKNYEEKMKWRNKLFQRVYKQNKKQIDDLVGEKSHKYVTQYISQLKEIQKSEKFKTFVTKQTPTIKKFEVDWDELFKNREISKPCFEKEVKLFLKKNKHPEKTFFK